MSLGEARSNGAGPVRLLDDIWRVDLPMATPTPAWSTCIIDTTNKQRVMLIDPGWDDDTTLETLRSALRYLGRDLPDVGAIAVTHRHVDHAGLANRLRERTGARVLCFPAPPLTDDGQDLASRWGLDDPLRDAVSQLISRGRRGRTELDPDDAITHGDTLLDSGWVAVHTPGHTADHLCFAYPDGDLLVTGDHVLPDVFPGIGLGPGFPENPIVEYLRSLDALGPFHEFSAVPGHGETLAPLGPRLLESRRHVTDRLREVSRIVLADPDATVAQIASRISWRAGWDKTLKSRSLMSALRQTEYYREAAVSGGLDHIA